MSALSLFSLGVLVFSIVIHEVAHGIAALYQGDETAKRAGRLTLNPVPHIDVLGSIIIPLFCVILPGSLVLGWAKPVPVNPYNFRNRRFGEALVAFAGPASNITIALIIGLFLRFWGQNILGVNPNTIELLQIAVLINLVLAVFNLMPLPPLDGSKILYSLFPDRYGRFVRMFEQYGLIFTVIFIFLFIRLLDPIIFSLYRLITG